MTRIPRDLAPDSSLALLRDGYRFIPKRVRRHKSDIFRTRLMLRKATCVSGTDAAEMFYQPDRFTRVGAMPPTVVRLLQDIGSVQTLDGDAHRHRKAMFMSMMGPESIDRLMRVTEDEWQRHIEDWSERDRVPLFEEMEHLLTRAACAFAGIELSETESLRRTREFSAMIAGAGGIGPETWKALLLRRHTEGWARRLVRSVRSGRKTVEAGTPLDVIANHRDEHGRRLPAKIAAVELINVLRPTVAVARYVVFLAHALHEHPEWAHFARSEDELEVEAFVQEVRRLYPFFPFIAGVARQPFRWRDHGFDAGEWIILDIYGTNRDPRSWENPDQFNPGRFRDRPLGPYDLIPQGGGDHLTTHRCAGEWITIALMKQAAEMLTRRIDYTVPEQDLSIDLRQMPALPASRFIIADVRRR